MSQNGVIEFWSLGDPKLLKGSSGDPPGYFGGASGDFYDFSIFQIFMHPLTYPISGPKYWIFSKYIKIMKITFLAKIWDQKGAEATKNQWNFGFLMIVSCSERLVTHRKHPNIAF